MKHRSWLVVCSALQLALLGVLTFWVRKHPHPVREIRFIRWMQQKRSPLARQVVLLGSMGVGESIWLNALVIPTALFFWFKRLRLEAVMTLWVIWIAGLLRGMFQHCIHRPRPRPALLFM